jgi:hypothetical protein
MGGVRGAPGRTPVVSLVGGEAATFGFGSSTRSRRVGGTTRPVRFVIIEADVVGAAGGAVTPAGGGVTFDGSTGAAGGAGGGVAFDGSTGAAGGAGGGVAFDGSTGAAGGAGGGVTFDGSTGAAGGAGGGGGATATTGSTGLGGGAASGGACSVSASSAGSACSTSAAAASSSATLAWAARSALADLMSRGGPSLGFAGSGVSAFGFVVRPRFAAARRAVAALNIWPPGRSIPRSRPTRSAN